jgi:hypothetical protein
VTGTVGELGGLALSVVVLVVREEDTLNREATRCDHQLATAAVAREEREREAKAYACTGACSRQVAANCSVGMGEIDVTCAR